jgi:ATP-dependent Clp protease adaptor protein ClpS
MAEYISKPGDGTALQEKQKVTRPRRYKVLLHNDHYTTMDFVILVLCQVFHKPGDKAYEIMLAVHRSGVGVAGVYPKSLAEAKIDTVHHLARKQGFPLKCSMERE